MFFIGKTPKSPTKDTFFREVRSIKDSAITLISNKIGDLFGENNYLKFATPQPIYYISFEGKVEQYYIEGLFKDKDGLIILTTPSDDPNGIGFNFFNELFTLSFDGIYNLCEVIKDCPFTLEKI